MTFIKINTLFYLADQDDLYLIEMDLLKEEQLDIEPGEEWININTIERIYEAQLEDNTNGTTVHFISGEVKAYDIPIDEFMKQLNDALSKV